MVFEIGAKQTVRRTTGRSTIALLPPIITITTTNTHTQHLLEADTVLRALDILIRLIVKKHSFQISTIIVPILQMRNLRLKEAR